MDGASYFLWKINDWIPACAGMTTRKAGMTTRKAGMTTGKGGMTDGLDKKKMKCYITSDGTLHTNSESN